MLYAPGRVKKFVWDRLFARISQQRFAHSADDRIYPYLEKYTVGRSVLDLGCGTGTTASEMVPNYTDYLGVDISEVALQQAEQRKAISERLQNRFVQGDIQGYEPEHPFGVILFRDSLYYVPENKIKGMLDRYSNYLNPDGVFLVKMHLASRKRADAIVKLIQSEFTVIEQSDFPSVVLVFQPRTRPARIPDVDEQAQPA